MVDQNRRMLGVEISNLPDQIGFINDVQRRSLIIRPGRRFTKLYKKSFLIENSIQFPEQVGYGDNYYAFFWLYMLKNCSKWMNRSIVILQT